VLLDDYITRCQQRRFCWSDWNCVHFSRGWVFLYEGHYIEFPVSFADAGVRTALGAAKYVRSLGGLPNIVTRSLGRDPVPPTYAGVGDLVHFGSGSFAGTLGVCNGRTAFALSTDVGVVSVPMSGFELCWKLKCRL
jgi:hypothetical protein